MALSNSSSNTSNGAVGMGFWEMFFLMYIHTSDTVAPVDKMEFFWRFLAGPLNFLPFL